MKKNDLIKMLQGIEGNPEIVIWNGYVDDYMNISTGIEKITLVKETEKLILDGLKGMYMQFNNVDTVPPDEVEKLQVQAKQIHKERKWDFPNPYVEEKDFEYWYGKKTLTKYVISPKLRGKTSLGVFNAADLNY
ncbi:hypothetical protein ABV23_RS01045 [Escherichia coli]|nr:hypothetical protein [Escherichia coli]